MAGFGSQVGQWAGKTERKLDLVHRKVALDLFTSVVLKSPVDTGRFRANWQVSVGSAPSGTLELDDTSGTATISKADATVAGVKAGQAIFIVNNLPYGPLLEDGYSSQAPAGMVRLTVQQFSSILAQAGAEVSIL